MLFSSEELFASKLGGFIVVSCVFFAASFQCNNSTWNGTFKGACAWSLLHHKLSRTKQSKYWQNKGSLNWNQNLIPSMTNTRLHAKWKFISLQRKGNSRIKRWWAWSENNVRRIANWFRDLLADLSGKLTSKVNLGWSSAFVWSHNDVLCDAIAAPALIYANF